MTQIRTIRRWRQAIGGNEFRVMLMNDSLPYELKLDNPNSVVEYIRPAVLNGAGAIVLVHNHPSGDPGPSESDIKTTRDLMRAGQIMKVDVLDHVILGHDRHTSLRELGHMVKY